MEFDEIVRKRRSIRKYLSVPVGRELIAKIIQAGNEAPCAGNIQNWRFIIVEDEKLKKKIAKAALEQYWIATAPVVIVVCSDNDEIKKFYGLRGERLYSIQNCAAAIENMLLKVVELGLGSCWVSAFDENELSRDLEIPDNVRPQAILPIGYPAEEVPRAMRFRLEDICFISKWGNKIEFEDAYLRNYRIGEKLIKSSKNLIKKIKGKE